MENEEELTRHRPASFVVSESKQLVKKSIERTAAHGLPRAVSEKAIYIRALWLVVWVVFCCLFLRQLIFFINKLQKNEVTTNFQADAVNFEYPDLYFCFSNPMSGSRHLTVDEATAEKINSSFRDTFVAIDQWCKDINQTTCQRMYFEDGPELQLNSLPYKLLVDKLGHSMEQSIITAEIAQSNGLTYSTMELPIEPFYHPSHLRCFRTRMNATHREEMKYAGPDDVLYFLLMMDAPDSRMGQSELPNVRTFRGDLTPPYWALSKRSLSSRVRNSMIRVYITQSGHYPSDFDELLVLEAGQSYNVHLEMKELIHRDDPNTCIEEHPDVQMLNPYDDTPYNVSYDYAYCYNSAVQYQFFRELSVTCSNLPHSWPAPERSLYNVSSGWGTTIEVKRFLEGKDKLRPNEPRLLCANSGSCTERVFTPLVKSVLWPSADSIDSIFDECKILDDKYFPNAPGLRYLRGLAANDSAKNKQLMSEYIRANFVQLTVRAKKPMADQTIFTRAYSFESFVADIGGTMGVYLGMSLLTLCELIQFLHDLFLICWWSGDQQRNKEEKSKDVEAADQDRVETRGGVSYL